MRKFKALIGTVLSAAVLALTLSSCGSQSVSVSAVETNDSGIMRKDMTAADFIREMGVGINLGNTFEAYWADENNKTSGAQTIGGNDPGDYERCWGAVTTQQRCMDGIRDMGFNTVRIPVYWGNMMADDGKFNINEKYMDRVEEVVNYALSDGLYVVINCHHYDEFIIKNYPREEAVDISKNIWSQIAKRFRNYSDYLIFEGYNENLGTRREGENFSDKEMYPYVNEMNQVFVDTVRATGGNNKTRMLIASGFWTNIDLTTAEEFKMPDDKAEDRLMVSVHYVDNAMYWSNQIGGDKWMEYATAQCELLKAKFTDNGIPVFVGECTSIYDDDRFANDASITDSSECLETMLQMEIDYGFIPVLWDVSNNFYNRITSKTKHESDAAVIAKLAAEFE